MVNFLFSSSVCSNLFEVDGISESIIEDFHDKKIVVVGDVVADQFLHGTIDRISREAPVFIVRHDVTETRGGGAANAASNVASLSGNAVLVGIVGEDESGKDLLRVLESSSVDCDYVIAKEDFKTTTKLRVLAAQDYAKRQQVIRIDYEVRKNIDEDIIEELQQNIIFATENADAIIISDYGYGVAAKKIAETCTRLSKEKNIPLLIDSRTRLEEFNGATAATPNQEETEHILGKNFTESDCEALRAKFDLEVLLVTRGNKGMLFVEKDREPLKIDVIGSKEPVDVTGAGDTVIATYALGLASGLNFLDAARIANHAGGIAVMKKGTACVSIEELSASLKNYPLPDFKTRSN